MLAEKKTFWCVKLVVLSVKTEQKIFLGGNFESRSFFSRICTNVVELGSQIHPGGLGETVYLDRARIFLRFR